MTRKPVWKKKSMTDESGAAVLRSEIEKLASDLASVQTDIKEALSNLQASTKSELQSIRAEVLNARVSRAETHVTYMRNWLGVATAIITFLFLGLGVLGIQNWLDVKHYHDEVQNDIRGIEANLGPHHADTFHNDLHKDLKADFILANPAFNMSDWGGERLRDDARWKYGAPPVGNANFAWVQHIIHHLAPAGVAGFVLANGSMSSNQSGEGEIRRKMVEADLMDCMIALPPQLFYGTQIPACLWFLARNKTNGKFRDRRRKTLLIDARKMGNLVDRVHRELSEDDIDRIAGAYHAWRGEKDAGKYTDVAGFCKTATTDEIISHDFILTPGRYVGAEQQQDDGEPFEEKMKRLTATLREQFQESAKLEKAIRANLKGLGFEV
jgi:hypothetical protein